MLLLTTGTAPEVWEGFKPRFGHALVKENGIGASDQYLIYKILGSDVPVWNEADGVYMYTEKRFGKSTLPENARIVFFPGRQDPSQPSMQERHDWIAKHWT